jgi:carbamoyl-phosphate synthase large subunit
MIYCFDLDGTLCSDTQGDYPSALPVNEMIKKVNKLYELGHTVFIYTARGGTTGKDWRELTQQQLASWGVKYHELVMGKPAADYYIDDKAVPVLTFRRIFQEDLYENR